MRFGGPQEGRGSLLQGGQVEGEAKQAVHNGSNRRVAAARAACRTGLHLISLHCDNHFSAEAHGERKLFDPTASTLDGPTPAGRGASGREVVEAAPAAEERDFDIPFRRLYGFTFLM